MLRKRFRSVRAALAVTLLAGAGGIALATATPAHAQTSTCSQSIGATIANQATELAYIDAGDGAMAAQLNGVLVAQLTNEILICNGQSITAIGYLYSALGYAYGTGNYISAGDLPSSDYLLRVGQAWTNAAYVAVS
jgi:hypothetical protein